MQERRLAAIMFTDIVGYTSLMGSDEDRAFETLRKNREIHSKLIEQFNGTLIKEMGDGMLISFNLAADAVHCAIEIQKKAKNDLDAQVRIGIHLGDIMFENDDVFGDGVNLASRLQSITDPGGIYLSESLQKSIRGKSDIKTSYLGEFKLKNVDYPVRTYAVLGGELAAPNKERIQELSGKSLRQRIFGSSISYIIFLVILVASIWGIRSMLIKEKPTLLILTPENNTGIDTIPHIISGIHTSLIGEIGKIGELNIISPYTSKSFKDSGKSLKEIAKETKANYIAQPALSCIGDNVCLNFIMTKIGSKEKEIWSEDFHDEKRQIFDMYNQITKEIAGKINIVLSPEEELSLAEARMVDPEAYEAFLKGQYYWNKLDKESIQLALKYFQLAIDKDPDWADPYAGLANAWGLMGTLLRILPKSVTLPKVYSYLDTALELNPNSAKAHYVKALTAVWTEFDWVQGEKEFLKVIDLNPNDALCRMYYAHLLMILGRSDEAVIQSNLGLKLDPLKPLVLGLGAAVMRREDDREATIMYLEKALSIDPNFGFAGGNLNKYYMHEAYNNGEYEKWIKFWDKKVGTFGHWNAEGRTAVLNAFYENGRFAAIEEMFRMNEKHGNNCYMSGGIKAERYSELEKYDKAMNCLEEEYERRDMSITYLATNKRLYEHLKDNPRYISLLKKMNLPYQ